MANFKAILRTVKPDRHNLTPIYIQVTHAGKTRYINTGIRVEANQFINGQVINHTRAKELNIKIRHKLNVYEQLAIDLGFIRLKNMPINTLIERLNGTESTTTQHDLFSYTKQYIADLKAEGRTSYAGTFENSLKKIAEATGADYLPFADITPHKLTEMARRMTLQRLSPTTIGIYMRNIRTIINKAITDPAIKLSYNDYPFRDYTIPKALNRRINLDAPDMRLLINYKPTTKAQQQAKDLFLLSFYLIGINFKDLLTLTRADVYKGRILFNRAKTGKPYSILIQPEAEAILNKYQGVKLLMNILEHKKTVQTHPDRTTPLYKDVTDRTNRLLKTIATGAGLSAQVSTYYARHTWATIARNIGIPKDDIVTALGHGSNTVTDAYIDIDLTRIDEANRRVIDKVLTI